MFYPKNEKKLIIKQTFPRIKWWYQETLKKIQLGGSEKNEPQYLKKAKLIALFGNFSTFFFNTKLENEMNNKMCLLQREEIVQSHLNGRNGADTFLNYTTLKIKEDHQASHLLAW